MSEIEFVPLDDAVMVMVVATDACRNETIHTFVMTWDEFYALKKSTDEFD